MYISTMKANVSVGMPIDVYTLKKMILNLIIKLGLKKMIFILKKYQITGERL